MCTYSFRVMASCYYSQFVGGVCGPSITNPANVQCISIGQCNKDIHGHLNTLQVRDSSFNSEAILLLARAGKRSLYLDWRLHEKIGHLLDKILRSTVTISVAAIIAVFV